MASWNCSFRNQEDSSQLNQGKLGQSKEKTAASSTRANWVRAQVEIGLGDTLKTENLFMARVTSQDTCTQALADVRGELGWIRSKAADKVPSDTGFGEETPG